MEWPPWWSWELDLSPHLFKRMLDRQFNEVDLRLMLEQAKSWHEDREEGRYVIHTTHQRHRWTVVVEPVSEEQVLIVITAYPVD